MRLSALLVAALAAPAAGCSLLELYVDQTGYRISVVKLRGNVPQSYETFAEGWLQGNDAWGRPVDLIVAPDGALLVSDDVAGAIYRIAYRGPARKGR